MGREPEPVVELRRALGVRLATFRKTAGLTQDELARQLFCDRSTVAHVERGRSQGTPEFWRAVDAAVGAGGVLVSGFGELIAAQQAHQAHAREAAFTRARAHVESILHDRTPLGHQPGVRGGVFDVPASDGGMAGVSWLAAIQAMSESFQMTDRRLGGGVLYGQVVRYIRSEIAPLLLDPPEDCSSPDMFSAAASFAEVAGWMAHDGGHNTKAQAHFGQAYRLATVAGNPVLTANICASMAHLAIQLGQAHDAVRIATAGLPRAAQRQGTTHLTARLHAMRARACALNGDGRECRGSLEQAHDTLGTRGAHDGHRVGWIAEFDEASLAGETALCLYTLGSLTEAEAQARTVVALRVGDRVRSRALGQLTLANILHAAGEPAEAAVIGSDICATAAGLGSARVHTGLTALGQTLTAHRSVPEVTAFLDHAASINQPRPALDHEPRWPL